MPFYIFFLFKQKKNNSKTQTKAKTTIFIIEL